MCKAVQRIPDAQDLDCVLVHKWRDNRDLRHLIGFKSNLDKSFCLFFSRYGAMTYQEWRMQAETDELHIELT